jgi:hypothetical protein
MIDLHVVWGPWVAAVDQTFSLDTAEDLVEFCLTGERRERSSSLIVLSLVFVGVMMVMSVMMALGVVQAATGG